MLLYKKDMAEKSGKDFYKEFIRQARDKCNLAENLSEDVNVTDIMFSLVKKKYENERSNTEGKSHEELMFQMLRPKMPFENWMPDLIPWKVESAVSCV